MSNIYKLIQKDNSINTFNNNKDLFLEFYYHDIDLIYGEPNTIDIFKYILSLNLDDENEELPYINSKIFDAFNRYEQRITQSVYINNNFDDSYVEKIYELIKNYNFIYKYKDNGKLHKLYNEKLFIRDVTGSMMILLNSSFFNISNENIKRMMDSIRNNKYLENIINSNNTTNGLLDKEYIYDYTSRFLFNSFFLNKENIKNDELLTAIKEHKITDKELLNKIFINTDINFIQITFNDNLSSILDVIENSFKDTIERINLFNIIINKLNDNRDYEMIIKFIMNDERSKKYIDNEKKKRILLLYPFSTSKDLTEEEVNYYIDNNMLDKIFLNNLKEELNHNNWSEKTIKKVEEVTKNIEFYNYKTEEALKVLEALFTKEKNVSYSMLIASLKRLIKDYVKDENIKIFITYKESYNTGTASPEENTIVLNVSPVIKLLDAKIIDSNPEILGILETVFHESRHIIQFRGFDQEDDNEELYNQYKEEILGNINIKYYEKNYIGVSYEQDARIHGAQGVVKLLEKAYPYMTQSIKYYSDKTKKEIDKKYSNKKNIFELSENISVNDTLEKIISINPSIVEKYPRLKREYDSNGNKINTGNKKI